MPRWVLLASCVTMVAGAGACGASTTGSSPPRVVASFYPLAWVAGHVGGADVRVRDLTPPGADPHDVEMTPRARAALEVAAVRLVMGDGFQPTVEQAAGRKGTLAVLPELPVVGDDPHVWLDPVLMMTVTDEVADALARAVPARRAEFAARADELERQLAALDADYRNALASCARREIVTNHSAFGYLARRYGLTQVSISGLAPDEEPSPARLAELSALVARHGVTTIFTEDALSTKVADVLARETGTKTAVLSPVERLSDAERSHGDDYLTLMRRNLSTLRAGLGCGG